MWAGIKIRIRAAVFLRQPEKEDVASSDTSCSNSGVIYQQKFNPSKNVTSCGDSFSGNDCTNLSNLPPVFGVPAEENQDRKLKPMLL